MDESAVPIRLSGRFRLFQQRDGGVINSLPGHYTASEALHELAIQIEHLTDGCSGVRVTRKRNVTTLYYQHHAPVKLWAEVA